MPKATIAKLIHATHSKGMTFRTTEGLTFYVTKLENGILKLEPHSFSTIYHMTEIVAGCFASRSTFAGVKEVNFIFNGKKVSVKKEENATPQLIYKKWYDAPYEE